MGNDMQLDATNPYVSMEYLRKRPSWAVHSGPPFPPIVLKLPRGKPRSAWIFRSRAMTETDLREFTSNFQRHRSWTHIKIVHSQPILLHRLPILVITSTPKRKRSLSKLHSNPCTINHPNNGPLATHPPSFRDTRAEEDPRGRRLIEECAWQLVRERGQHCTHLYCMFDLVSATMPWCFNSTKLRAFLDRGALSVACHCHSQQQSTRPFANASSLFSLSRLCSTLRI